MSFSQEKNGDEQQINISIYDDPFQAFIDLYQNEAVKSEVQPECMILSTVSEKGTPSSRVVLLRGHEENGFTFYTNYLSQKAKDLSNNSNVSLLFFWQSINRQVRIEGICKKTSSDVSDAYWDSRPVGHQIGSYVSKQSSEIESIEFLRNEANRIEKELGGKGVARPEHWGGYTVIPNKYEFWSLGEERLHERVVFVKSGEKFTKKFLSP